MRPPLIGITAPHAGRRAKGRPSLAPLHTYGEAVAAGGGLPVIIAPVFQETQLRSLFERLDGIVFSGGGDVSPSRYGEAPGPHLRTVDEARDLTEISLVHWAVESGKPFLGICRGLQVINVALGGNLHQHLDESSPGTLRHDDEPAKAGKLSHSVHLMEDSILAGLLGESELQANSYHHQAIKGLGRQLKANGWAEDGTVEAIELIGHPFGLAVQWHPERLLDRPEALALFQALAEISSGS